MSEPQDCATERTLPQTENTSRRIPTCRRTLRFKQRFRDLSSPDPNLRQLLQLPNLKPTILTINRVHLPNEQSNIALPYLHVTLPTPLPSRIVLLFLVDAAPRDIMYKYIEVCVSALAFISVAAFPTSENNETGPTIAAIPKARVRGVDADVGSIRNQTDERKKRAVSAIEREVIMNAFNCGRSLVGASDMNYLTWNSASENDANIFMERCDPDTSKFVSTTDTTDTVGGVMTAYTKVNEGHNGPIDFFFRNKAFKVVATSKNLLQVSAGGYKFCPTLIEDGRILSNMHYFVYGVTADKNANVDAPQYTIGAACTRCKAGVKWCYSGLCRDDCSSSIPGCCQITSNMPAECLSSDLTCQADPAKAVNTVKPGSGSSSTEVKASIVMLAIVSALRSCLL